jgi:predicted ATPase
MNKKFMSEIRDSITRELLGKVRKGDYGKYLTSTRLEKVRLFRGGQVKFDFPVTALIGPNGGGKSTILGAAACAYKSIKPGTFFPKSSIGDDSMEDWSIEYELIDKSENDRGLVRRSSKFKRLRWVRENLLDREVKYFGINRTVPAGEKTQFKKLLKPSFRQQQNIPIYHLLDNIKREVEKILGKSMEAFKVADVGDEQKFYIGGDTENEYSEFHFGAGEASIIRIVSDLELSSNNSLILIEEIENGLHPVAVRRLVEYLMDVAKRKSIQAIFTTHSDAALEPLPSEAIWSSIDGKVQQGKLSVEALRAVSGRIDRKLAIFVEDEFAKDWVEAILREKIGERLDEIGVYAVAGDGNAVKIHLGHMSNPSIPFYSLCFIDGDSREIDNPQKGIYRLPGSMPECTVFNSVLENLDNNIALLTVACQRPAEKQQDVANIVRSISYTNRDPHLLFSQVGIKMGFVPEAIIKGAFLSVWLTENTNDIAKIIETIKKTIDLPLKV